ncbi:hypothetical protein K8354_15190 [Polaribacter litorisediminis]|uniref:hypothetical protein n=1 Tax=Polaribacter litorisediminis TaxID=1908341 RepID=UPI001CBB2743|nr:hypothetical protein [Polaribacter litorisediminis]UAM97632.1 hypothetical protein K8354_15190 [Polaribacter litorisediminis]
METKLHKIITLLLVTLLPASILIAQTLPEGNIMKDIDGGTFIMGNNSLKGSIQVSNLPFKYMLSLDNLLLVLK